MPCTSFSESGSCAHTDEGGFSNQFKTIAMEISWIPLSSMSLMLSWQQREAATTLTLRIFLQASEDCSKRDSLLLMPG